MPPELTLLLLTAGTLGVTHTLLGPDHYVPFLALARAGDWRLGRTLGVTLLCGIGHVLGSVALGALGLALGWAVSGMEAFEAFRGEIAGWLLLGFGLAYGAWGLRRAIRNRPHSHLHAHADGTVHRHRHTHHRGHVHVHRPLPGEGEAGAGGTRAMTPWVLFVLFVFGPCEPLIPVLMAPAAEGSAWGVALVAAVFAAATLGTMLAVVTVGYYGLSRFAFGRLERYSHALAGLALAACGLAIQLGL